VNNGNLKPFTKGKDIRRNTKGRPKDFDAVRALALKILKEKVSDTDGMAKVEKILRDLYTDAPEKLLMYGFGKIPDQVITDGITHIFVSYEKQGDPDELRGEIAESASKAGSVLTEQGQETDCKSG
jgi:hypothetical protein